MYMLSLSPPSPSVFVCVCEHIHIRENEEVVSDDEKPDFLGKKMRLVIANYSGCPRQGWKSVIEIVLGFGGC